MGLGLESTEGGDAMTSQLWMVMVGIAGLYCLVRGVNDLRHKRFVWGAIGLACGGFLLLTPIQSQAVKYDLPPQASH
jgi:hypothetical protein